MMIQIFIYTNID